VSFHGPMRSPFALLLLAAACADTPSPVAPPAHPLRVASPSASGPAPAATTRVSTFAAPEGWAVAYDGTRTVLTGPEPDLQVAIAESTAASADAAVASAWRSMHPDFKRGVKLARPSPGREGWDERRVYSYETSPDEKLTIYATALRKAMTWVVLLVEGSDSSFEKRFAGVARVEESLHPNGYVRESFAGKTPHKLDADRIQKIVTTVDRLRERSGVPGAALALVQDGKVVYEGALGAREVAKPDKVTPRTMFQIASLSKSLTTLLLAKLVDEGKLHWDTPVVSLYPSFRLGDDATTRRVLVKHLVCACTGLPRHDWERILDFENGSPRKEMDLIGTMQPTTGFGETFQYSNDLASAAGYVAGHVVEPKAELGAAYERAMQSRVLGPLGMTETTFDLARVGREVHATGHETDFDGKTRVTSIDMVRAATIVTRPSGGAWSTVHDLAKVLAMELANGKLPDGQRYVSEDALLERRKPQVAMSERVSYGMGLAVSRSWGIPVLAHNGMEPGFRSEIFFIPDAAVGGVILMNGPMVPGITRRTLEVLFEGRSEGEEDAADEIAGGQAELAATRKLLTFPPDAAVIAKLSKRYANPALGWVEIVPRGASWMFDTGGWKSPFATRNANDGTTSILLMQPRPDWFDFVIGERAGKRTLTLRDAQHEYVFTEVK